MNNPIIFWWAMLWRLPSVIFWSVKIKKLDFQSCEVSIPYSWRTQNPFKSIYFAALAGAAELSTGALCQLVLAGKGNISMLVVDFKAEFYKKANQSIIFKCEQGTELSVIIDELKSVGDTAIIQMGSDGFNPEGVKIATFYVTWSFKRKA